MKRIIITGGTGLIGKHLSLSLINKGFEVVFLSRKEDLSAKIKKYKWNIENAFVDENVFKGAETIIHLAGANVAKGRWTAARKKEILESRVNSTQLLFDVISKNNIPIKNFISANAIGIYGDRNAQVLTEEDSPGNDFLADVCKKWERSLMQFEKLNIRTASFRIGLVLAKEGGVLPNMLQTAKFRINPVFGKGSQFYSWIHINDIVKMVELLIRNVDLTGHFNCTAPNPVTNETMIREIEKALNFRTLKPKVPSFILKTVLGEMAGIVLSSAKVIPQRMTDSGFQFEFNYIEEALKDLIN